MDASREVRRGHSRARDAAAAVRELHAAIVQPNLELVVFFCSTEYDLDALAAEMVAAFGTTSVVGCTTAGEFGPAGYLEGGLSGFSLSADAFVAVSGRLGDLQHFEFSRAQCFVGERLEELAGRAPHANGDNSFALQLIDGLSVREEPATRAFQQILGGIPLVGGSAGDGLRFERTGVYFAGQFHADSAVLVVVTTPLPIKPFMTQHFAATARRVVVTDADSGRRLVREIDGRPAAVAYADLVGVRTDNLDPQRFAASPMVVVIGGVNYVRSISKALPDGSLKFFCAIDEGLVLRVAHATDLVANLEQALDTVRSKIGEPQLIIGCDCILRRLEIIQSGTVDRVADLLTRNHAVGFATYGEQYRGVHVNQTFTGIAIGRAPEASRG